MATRTLLLAPPSISSHPELLDQAFQAFDRTTSDLQMLDRIAAGLVQLPAATYDLVLLMTDADGTTRQSQKLLTRSVMTTIADVLKPGGQLRPQHGTLSGAEKTEAILAGLTESGEGMVKDIPAESVSIPLKLGRKKAANGPANGKTIQTSNAQEELNTNGKRFQVQPPNSTQPAGVGFVDFSDDLDDLIVTGEDDELIDEDDLITEEDMARPVIQPPECRPKAGKRRRACKDCTCGMKEKIEAEDAAKRANADKALRTLKLEEDDLAEVDFTIQGKVGSCGNCALGDAFRCDGCPYIGLPAFKPGEEVRLLNNDIQL